MSKEISEVTHRAIVDLIIASGFGWSGHLDEADFLARLYDLTSIPSGFCQVYGTGAISVFRQGLFLFFNLVYFFANHDINLI
ncbi:MAG: hypothetical protein L6420_02825 [Elusimicrobia bacterium]|nr:hypothetical protein [Elusimicrobiota bacterium]